MRQHPDKKRSRTTGEQTSKTSTQPLSYRQLRKVKDRKKHEIESIKKLRQTALDGLDFIAQGKWTKENTPDIESVEQRLRNAIERYNRLLKEGT